MITYKIKLQHKNYWYKDIRYGINKSDKMIMKI